MTRFMEVSTCRRPRSGPDEEPIVLVGRVPSGLLDKMVGANPGSAAMCRLPLLGVSAAAFRLQRLPRAADSQASFEGSA